MIEKCVRQMFLDKVVVFLLYSMAIIPFSQVFYLNVGLVTFNTYELLLLALCFVFILIIIKRGIAKEHANYVLFVVTMFVVYSSCSLVFLDVSFSSWVTQTRFFLPFIVACMALLTRLYIDKAKFLNGITLVLAVSALLAIIIHLFFKDFLAYAFAASDDVSRIIQGGRMYWGSSVLALFGFAAFMIEKNKNRRMLLMLAVFVILVAILFTQNRTILAGLMFLFFAAQFFVFKKAVRPFVYISIFSLISAVIFFYFASNDMIVLFQKRLFLTDSAGAEIDHAFFIGRVGLYNQYLDRLGSTFPFGQSLGLPFAYGIFSGEPIFVSDISLLSFSISFGLLGLVALLIFIAKLFKSFEKYKMIYRNDKSPKVFYWLLFTAFIISLNVDIFSRNIFVVYLAVFAVLHFVPSAKRIEKVLK